MPEPIRIPDLCNPVLTPGQQMGIDFGEKVHTELSVQAVLDAATARANSDNFGPQDFRERLALWLDEVDHDDQRTGLGRMLVFNDCVRNATARVRINDFVAAHPEVHDQQIVAPIIVVGLPRSGTTHLVNLIAADTRLRSMPLWEGQEPIPIAGEPADADGHEPRWHRCNATWLAMLDNAPMIAAMHPMAPDHIHEELELQLPDFTSYNQEWVTRAPRWRDYYLAHDQKPHYQYLRTMLKILQFQRPRERWILKSPQHLEQLGPLLDTFPDATIVMTHRDPVSVIQSAITMLTYGARMSYRTPDPQWYLEYWTDRVHRLLTASIRDRSILPADRTIDVLFHEFMADDLAMVDRIYEVARLPMTARARAEIAAYLEAHSRGKDGQVMYDLRNDFDVAPHDVRAAFDFYLNRFPVKVEVQ